MEIIVAEIVVSSPRKRFVIGFALKQTVLVPWHVVLMASNTGDTTVCDRRSGSRTRVGDRYLGILSLRSGLPFIPVPAKQNLQLSSEVNSCHRVKKEVDAVVEAEDGFGDVEGSTQVGWAGWPCGTGTQLVVHPHTPDDEVGEVEGDKASRHHEQQAGELQLHSAWCVVGRKPTI